MDVDMVHQKLLCPRLKDVMTILAKEGFGVMSFMPTPANSCQSTIFDEISKELLAEIEAKAKSK